MEPAAKHLIPVPHQEEVEVVWAYRLREQLEQQAVGQQVWGAPAAAAGAVALTPPAAACVVAVLGVVRVGWCTVVQRQQHHRVPLGVAVSSGALAGRNPPPIQQMCEAWTWSRPLCCSQCHARR
jgi:hypothetical protein